MESKKIEGRAVEKTIRRTGPPPIESSRITGLIPGLLGCLGLSLFAAALLVVVTPSTTMGQAGYLTEVQTAYDGIGPGITGTDRDECFFCHFTGKGGADRNNFGASVYLFANSKGRTGGAGGIAAALADADFTSLDPDMDGVTTANENIAGTFPGYPDADGDGYVQYSYRDEGKGIVWYATQISDNGKGSSVLPPDDDIDDGDNTQGRSPATGWSDQDGMTAENIGSTTDSTAPTAIADLGCSATGADSVTLTWTPPGGDAVYYDIRYTTPTKAAAFTCPTSGVACTVTSAQDWEDMWDMADTVVKSASGDGGTWNTGSTTPLVRVFYEPIPGSGGDGTMVVEPTGITADAVEGTTIGLSAGWRPWGTRLGTFAAGEDVTFAIKTSDGVLITDFADDATAHTYEGLSAVSNLFTLTLGGGGCGGAVNTTAAGTATAVAATNTTIDVSMPYTNDDNNDNTYTVDYKLSTAGSWTNWVTGAAHVASPYTTTITGLTDGETYDVRATYNDGDGVTGTNPQTISSIALPANRTTVGAATAVAASTTTIDVSMPYTGDANTNNTYTVDYKLATAGSWTNWVTGAANTASPYTTTITGLTAGETYDVRTTYNDADGVNGTNPQTIAGITLSDNPTTVGVATAVAATNTTIDVTMPYTGDTNANNTYTVDYKLATAGSWTNWVTGAAHVASPYTTTITGLTDGETYDVRATYNDGDGVTGTNPQTIAGIALPANRTTVGAATAVAATNTTIDVTMPYTGDVNTNNTYTVDYKLATAGSWTNWVTGAANTASPYTTTIPGLTEGETYDVRATYNDVDGTNGTNPQTIAGIPMPVNTTTVGAATAEAASTTTIDVTMPYTNDGNANNTYTVDYKLATAGSWTNWVTGAAHVASPYTTTITGLTDAETYDVRVTYNDVDGVNGTNPQTIAGIALPTDKTTAGAATAVAASSTTIDVSMPYTDDTNTNNTYTVDYKLATAGSWTNWVTGAAHVASPYTTTITGLTAGETYDVRTTYNDADGVNGTNPQTIAGITLSNNPTTVGTATAVAATNTTIDVTMPYTGDTNANNTYTVDYKLATAGSWTNWVTGAAHVASPYTTTITGLTDGETYDVRATYNDADGVSGTNPQTIAGIALPANKTTVGTATAVAVTGTTIDVTMPYTGDGNTNNTYTVDYKLATAGSWTNWVTGAAHVASPYTTTITGLTDGETYDVRATYNDADGVNGTNPQTIAGIALPADKTTVGAATAVAATGTTIDVTMPYTGDGNTNNTYTVDYKLATAGSWTNWVTGAAHVASPYTTTITGLTDAETYDVRVTYNDADGVNGTNPQTIAGIILSIALPANETTVGTATAVAAGSTSIDVTMPYTDDNNSNNTYTVDYKLATAGSWTNWVTGAGHVASPYTTTITGLTAGETYDVRATYNDADGVNGTNPQTIAGITLSGDVTPPADVGTFAAADQGVPDGGMDFTWTNPGDGDFAGVLVLAFDGTCASMTDAPSQGVPYSVEDPIGSSTVVIVSASAVATSGSFTNSTYNSPVPRGAKYCVKAFSYDTANNYAAGITDVVIPTDRTLSNLGYNMISAPGELGAGVAATTLFNDEGLGYLRVMGWNGRYTSATTIEEMKGYWLLNRIGTSQKIDIDAAGSECDTYSCYTAQVGGFPMTLSVSRGWSLVGNPCLTNLAGTDIGIGISASDPACNGGVGTLCTFAEAVTAGFVRNQIYRWYSGSYTADAPNLATTGNLEPWKGYWFFVLTTNVTDVQMTCGTQ